MTPTTCQCCRADGGPAVPAVVVAYWGAHLCFDCAAVLAAGLDERDAWPPVTWTDQDRQLLG